MRPALGAVIRQRRSSAARPCSSGPTAGCGPGAWRPGESRAWCSLALTGLLALAVACSERPLPATRVALEDSAGVRLVRNPERGLVADSVANRFVEEVRIGVTDGAEEYQFQQPLALAVDPSSSELYVLDAGLAAVRVYSASGTFLRAFGGNGEGPGEFRYPTELVLAGDTVAVYDLRLERTSFFSRTGDFRGSHRTRRGDRYRFRVVGRDRAGWIAAGTALSRFDFEGAMGDGPFRDSTFFHRLDVESGGVGEPFLVQPGGRLFFVHIPTMDGTRTFPELTPPIFEPRPEYGVDSRGRIYLSDGAEYRIEVYEGSGRLLRRITRAHDPRPVTPQDLAAYRRMVRERLERSVPASRPQLDAYHAGRLRLPHLPVRPALGRLVVAADGAFLVERPDLTEEPFAVLAVAPWDLFDAEGRFLATLHMPARFLPMALHDWAITGLQLGAHDVPQVVRYGIGTPGALEAAVRRTG